MSNQIKVQAKPSGAYETVFFNPPGRLVFRCLQLSEQAKTAAVCKRWHTNLSNEQRAYINSVFPREQLPLVGGTLGDAIPIRTLPRVETALLRSVPSLAIGWIQVEPKVWTLFVFRREASQYPTEKEHSLLYYFTHLPDECNWQMDEEKDGKKIKALGSEKIHKQKMDPAIRAKIGVWEIEASCCPVAVACGEIWGCNCCSRPCGCWSGECVPWEIWSKIAFLFNCTQTLSVQGDRLKRRNGNYIIPYKPEHQYPYYHYRGTPYFPLTEPTQFWKYGGMKTLDSPTTWFAILRDERVGVQIDPVEDTPPLEPVEAPPPPAPAAIRIRGESFLSVPRASETDDEEESEEASESEFWPSSRVEPTVPRVDSKRSDTTNNHT